MVKHLLIFLALSVTSVIPALAVEEIMPMHPGAAFNEVGIGVAVAPIRRATSEDAPAASLSQNQQLHRNKVTLKIPAPAAQGERRLRMVEAKVSSVDGTLDFDFKNAPLIGQNVEIPGLIAPEYLAMDKFNLPDLQTPDWPEEPDCLQQTPLREPQAFARPDRSAEGYGVHAVGGERSEASAKVNLTYPEARNETSGAACTISELPVAEAVAATPATAAPVAVSVAELPAARTSLRPPATTSDGSRSPLAPPPGGPVHSLKPPGMEVSDGGTMATGLSIAASAPVWDDSAPAFASTMVDMGSVTTLSASPRGAVVSEAWAPNIAPVQNIPASGAVRKPRREPAALPEPDSQGLMPMRELRNVLNPISSK